MRTDPLTLGEFIDLLKRCDKEKHVYFEFCNLRPTRFDSYRGFYDQLALGYSEDAVTTVSDLLADAEAANGKTFEGYKGGSYLMDLNTPVWADKYGRWTRTAIIGVKEAKYDVFLLTINQDLFDE